MKNVHRGNLNEGYHRSIDGTKVNWYRSCTAVQVCKCQQLTAILLLFIAIIAWATAFFLFVVAVVAADYFLVDAGIVFIAPLLFTFSILIRRPTISPPYLCNHACSNQDRRAFRRLRTFLCHLAISNRTSRNHRRMTHSSTMCCRRSLSARCCRNRRSPDDARKCRRPW